MLNIKVFLLNFERVNPKWVTTGFSIVLPDEDTVVEGFEAKIAGIDGADSLVEWDTHQLFCA